MAELLAPAGNPEALDAAINEGADAVYLGLKSFNARMRSSNFAWSQFEAAVDVLHRRGKKILVTVNTVLQESETERMYRFLAYLDKIGPDGLIVQDFGVLKLARDHFPSLRIHASTQMNIASARAANTMSRSGVSRVVLARELGLEEVREIKERTSCELEVFVHGALCVSESGLCLFSSYLGGKSANRGICAQACRRLYTAEGASGKKQGYFFSPHDLQLVDRIPDLIQAGVHSFKIEGRMKSADYVGTVVSAYRYVMDHWEEDRKGAVETARRILANDFARAKTRYWYDSSSAEHVLNPDQAGGTGIYLGKIDKLFKIGEFQMASLKGGSYGPEVGDSLRFHRKDDSDRKSHKVQEVAQENGRLLIDIPEGFGSGDPVYLIQTKNMSKRYPRVLPNDMKSYRKQPGDDHLEELHLAPLVKAEEARKSTKKSAKEGDHEFPSGLWVQVSSIEDVYQLLTDRPIRVILELNQATIKALLGIEATATGDSPAHETPDKAVAPLPFSKKELILSLDPYLPQALEDGLSTNLESLIENGYTQFIVNNPGHIGMLRNRGLKLIAGPYLYAFNRWAAAWLQDQGLYTIISPLENSRETLETTFDPEYRSNVALTIFAYPALFRMRFKLPANYDFTLFSDRQAGNFRALSTDDGSFVMPETPFSITDRSAALTKEGFSRQIIDLSKTRVNRQLFRQIMDSIHKGAPLTGASRFNWKDGFYDADKVEELRKMGERSAEQAAAIAASAKKGKGRKPSAPGSAAGREPASSGRKPTARAGGAKPAPRGGKPSGGRAKPGKGKSGGDVEIRRPGRKSGGGPGGIGRSKY